MNGLRWLCLLTVPMLVNPALAQSFYFGADLSYVNEMEDCGAVYSEGTTLADPYDILHDRGCNLVRLRLWHTPSWYDALNDGHRYSDIADVRKSIARAKARGMSVLLDFHLSDTWADPSHQVVPAAWSAVVHQTPVLADSVFNYIYGTLSQLAQADLLPDIVQLGNETNRSILLSQQDNDQGWSFDADRNVTLLKAAQAAVDSIEVTYHHTVRTAIHFANPDQVEWYTDQHVSHGYNGFDIIGISYYWQWHQPVTIGALGQTVFRLERDHPGKDVMVFETAYPWTTANADASNNILSAAHPSYSPLSPANQMKWMTDLTQTVIDNGGSGVIYWEPAWVSTGCATLWATGSAWDNATFFDFDGELITDGGVGWMKYPYHFTSTAETQSTTSMIRVWYADQEIRMMIPEGMYMDFPVSVRSYTIDGRLVDVSTATEASNQIVSVPISFFVGGCYIVTIADQRGVVGRGLVTVL